LAEFDEGPLTSGLFVLCDPHHRSAAMSRSGFRYFGLQRDRPIAALGPILADPSRGCCLHPRLGL